MHQPQNVGESMDLVQGVNWMRAATPLFSELMHPQQALLEQRYKLHKTRKKVEVLQSPYHGKEEQCRYFFFLPYQRYGK